MSTRQTNRRDFLSASTGAMAVGALAPMVFGSPALAQEKPRSPNERPGVGTIGLRYQDRMDQALFRKVALAVLCIAGLNLLRRGLM